MRPEGESIFHYLVFSDHENLPNKNNKNCGSGCGSVGRAVSSDTRVPRFESSHQQTFIHVFTINCIEKTKMKKKRPEMAHFLKKES